MVELSFWRVFGCGETERELSLKRKPSWGALDEILRDCEVSRGASQVLQGKVAEEPQLFVVSGAIVIVVAGLVEERMVCLGQQHFENKVVVVAAAIVKDLTI